MKVLLYDCGKEEILSLKEKTNLKINFDLDTKEKLLIDLDTKEVQISKADFGKMIFSNLEQFLTYYKGLEIIKGNGEKDEDNYK